MCISVIEGCQQPRFVLLVTRYDGRGPDGFIKRLLIFI